MGAIGGPEQGTARRALSPADTVVAVLAILLGIGLGTFVRNLPVVVATAVVQVEAESCTMEEAVECAFRDLPDALGAIITYGAIILLLAGAAAVGGALAIIFGLARLVRTGGQAAAEPDGQVDVRAVALLAGGSALVVLPASLVLGVVFA